MSNYFKIIENNTQNGPGIRVTIFLAGCNLKCKGCFNYEAWDFNSGETLTKEKINYILELLSSDKIQGLSILGGEPLDEKNQEATYKLISSVRKKFKNTKDIWCWTGYIVGQNLPKTKYTKQILKNLDCLIDGPFIQEQMDLTLFYRGSKNQRVLSNKELKNFI